jgi:hypothetical protein
MAMDANEKLEQLVGALCDGTLTADDYARLDSLLAHDDDARRFYNDYVFLHAELYSQHAAAVDIATFGPRFADFPVANSSPPEIRSATKLADSNPKSRLWWAAAAAVLAGVAIGSSWLTYLVAGRPLAGSVAQVPGVADEPSVESFAEAVESPSGSPVAKVTATRNCLWRMATNGVGFGTRLLAGQRVELAAGLVEITFDDGATVVLEGPATFDVRARGQARLEEGRLAAVVPEQARGFAIASTGLNVVDLGTEFGMMADREGATEVHVFDGLVKAQLLDGKGNEVRTVELNTAEAARIQPAVSLVARIPTRGDEFVRSLSVTSGPHDGLFAYDGFSYPAGPLGEQNGGFGWAGPWFNVEADAKEDANSNGVKPGGLEYEGVVTLGNRAVQTAHQNRIRRTLSTSVGGVFDAAGLVENQDGMRLVGRDGKTVYLSFLQRVDKINDVFYGVELHRSDGNAYRVLCIGNGAEGTGYGATSNYNVYGARNFPSLGQETTDVNFFVIRITYGPGNRDRVEVFRNPESLIDETACVADAELVGNFAFDRISIGNFHGTKTHEVDEIRVGTNFRAVTGRRSRGPDRLMPRVELRSGPLSSSDGRGIDIWSKHANAGSPWAVKRWSQLGY